jgi:hypothetical protein
MGIKELLFGGSGGPSERQIQRATKSITETHGDPAGRYSAASRLIEWGTPESLYAALLRFTIQLPSMTIDQAEKDELADMLVGVGQRMVEPIRKYLRLQTDVRWPCEILKRIVSEDEYILQVMDALDYLKDRHLRDEEHKARLIHMLPKPGTPESCALVAEFLENDNDEVAIAAVDFLAQSGNDDLRQKLIHLLSTTRDRPRVQAWIAEIFVERHWTVRPHSAEIEKVLPELYYLTSKGIIKRRTSLPE